MLRVYPVKTQDTCLQSSLLLLFILLLVSNLFAQNQFNYQGKLISNGQPLTGLQDISFRLYPELQAGDALWVEPNRAISLDANGIFSVVLGEAVPIPDSVFTENRTLFLGIQIGSATELQPRSLLIASPFSVKSTFANKMTASDGNPLNAVTVDSEGRVGIGTTAPRERLQIGFDSGAYFHDGGSKALSWNAWYDPDAQQWKYGTDNGAVLLSAAFGSNVFELLTAPSGTTGDPISWHPGLKIDFITGRVAINNNMPPQAELDVNGSIRTAAGQNFKIRHGSGSVVINQQPQHLGRDYGVIEFGYDFGTGNFPKVFITGTNLCTFCDAFVPTARIVTETGFRLWLFNSSGSTANGIFTFDWMAVGE